MKGRGFIIAVLIGCSTSAYCQTPKVWTKNPFVAASPPKSEPSNKTPDQEEGIDDVKERLSRSEVSAILYSSKHSSAVINGESVHIGSEFEGLKVLDIKKSYVILGKNKKKYQLNLRK